MSGVTKAGLKLSGFMEIPYDITKHKELSNFDKILFSIIYSYSKRDGNRYCYATNSALSSTLGKSIDTISKSISTLKKLDYLVVSNPNGFSRKMQINCTKIEETGIHVPYEIILSENLTELDKLVFGYINSFCKGKYKCCYAKDGTIGKQLNKSAGTINKSVSKLEKLKFISINGAKTFRRQIRINPEWKLRVINNNQHNDKKKRSLEKTNSSLRRNSQHIREYIFKEEKKEKKREAIISQNSSSFESTEISEKNYSSFSDTSKFIFKVNTSDYNGISDITESKETLANDKGELMDHTLNCIVEYADPELLANYGLSHLAHFIIPQILKMNTSKMKRIIVKHGYFAVVEEAIIQLEQNGIFLTKSFKEPYLNPNDTKLLRMGFFSMIQNLLSNLLTEYYKANPYDPDACSD